MLLINVYIEWKLENKLCGDSNVFPVEISQGKKNSILFFLPWLFSTLAGMTQSLKNLDKKTYPMSPMSDDYSTTANYFLGSLAHNLYT